MTVKQKAVNLRSKRTKITDLAKRSPKALTTFSEIAAMLNISPETLRVKTMKLRPLMKKNGTRKRLYTPKEVDRVINYVIRNL